jgi:antitoxin MazE
MGAKSHVSKWGTSLAVRIPRPIAEHWGVQEGSSIEIIPRGDEVVLRKRPYDLASLLAQVNPDNLHSEQDSGPAQGNEEW